MLSRKLIVRILLFSTSVLLIAFLLEKDNFYLGYIKLFKRTAIINNYNGSGQLHGEIIGYVDGNIYIRTNFINGLRNGLTTIYYKNGQIKNQSFFKNDKREGEEVGYYEDGRLNYKGAWKNNKGYGSAYHYTSDGKLTNYDGLDVVNLFFYMEYDSTGTTTKAFGSCFSSNIFSYDIKTDSIIVLRDNQPYQNINDLNVTVATPPNLIPQINVFINNRAIQYPQMKNNTITIKNTFLNKGIYDIKILGKLLNPKARVIKADTLLLSVTKN